MYEAIKKTIMDEFDVADTDNLSIEDAYEVLYRLTSRLSDMDDFSTSLLRSIAEKINQGASFETAFKATIDNEYEFADFDYFKDSFNHFKQDLEQEFTKAVKSLNPARSWNASINWMFDHAVINVNGTDYTIKQLKSELDKGDE